MKLSKATSHHKLLQYYYERGRREGFLKGKLQGLQQGVHDAKERIVTKEQRSQPALQQTSIVINTPYQLIQQDDTQPITKELIISKWGEFSYPGSGSGTLIHDKMNCLKETTKSSIWSLHVDTLQATEHFILKIIKAHNPSRDKSIVELNMYAFGNKILSEVMPQVYDVRVIDGNAWVLLEVIRPLEGQLNFTPAHFTQIIPSLAKMHSLSYNERFYFREELFMTWLPMYKTRPIYKQRVSMMEKTIEQLDKAMRRPALAKLIGSSYDKLINILRQGPTYFPELNRAGQSITHNDLQFNNIGCNNITEDGPWDIRFLDWEGAAFKPCWLDVSNLIGIFFSYRTDLRDAEEQIIVQCSELYAHEMAKHGISFQEDPVTLYKMAELQRLLEADLYHHLTWAIYRSSKQSMLQGSISRILDWSKKLGWSHE